MIFSDYVNINQYLYDNIDIDLNTINSINNYFALEEVATETFDFYFRRDLSFALPRYYQLIKLEMEKDLLSIDNNLKYRRLAEAKIQNKIDNEISKNKYNNKTVVDRNDETNDTTTNKTDRETTTDTNDKIADKQTPMSILANNYDGLFNWQTATGINEKKNNTETTENVDGETKTTSTDKIDIITTDEAKNENLKMLKGYLNNLNDIDELENGRNILAVEAIEKITDYLFKNNTAFDYLKDKLKNNFIYIYEL